MRGAAFKSSFCGAAYAIRALGVGNSFLNEKKRVTPEKAARRPAEGAPCPEARSPSHSPSHNLPIPSPSPSPARSKRVGGLWGCDGSFQQGELSAHGGAFARSERRFCSVSLVLGLKAGVKNATTPSAVQREKQRWPELTRNHPR